MQSGQRVRALRVAVLLVMALMVGAGWGKVTGVVHAQKRLDPTQQNQDPMTNRDPMTNHDPMTNQDPMMPSKVGPRGMPSFDPDMPNDELPGRLKEERLKASNDQRHKRLEDDVARLQALTNELKSDVDKASKDELSLDVIRKASEIEKLAHDVQSRMKN